MANRQLRAFGLNPLLGVAAIGVLFVVGSFFTFERLAFAEYLYALIPASFMMKLGEVRRNDFLKTCFSPQQYRQIRGIENLVLAFPFVVVLVVMKGYLGALLLSGVAIMLGFTSSRQNLNVTVPTPFSKHPFEFLVGFRNTFYVFLLSYLLVFAAVWFDNYNLGLFSLLLLCQLVVSYFYADPEHEYFVWMHSKTSKKLIWSKIKTLIRYSSLLALPVIIVLAIFYPANLHITAGLLVMGWVFAIAVMLVKYSAFPEVMGITESVIVGLGLFFLPLILVMIPYFYIRSIKQLDKYLI